MEKPSGPPEPQSNIVTKGNIHSDITRGASPVDTLQSEYRPGQDTVVRFNKRGETVVGGKVLPKRPAP